MRNYDEYDRTEKCSRNNRAYGVGDGAGFAGVIATLILGFGSAEYLGNPETVKAE